VVGKRVVVVADGLEFRGTGTGERGREEGEDDRAIPGAVRQSKRFGLLADEWGREIRCGITATEHTTCQYRG
jgi:hypothetical protein